MPGYGPIRLELAQQQYRTLPPTLRELVGRRVVELLEDPTGAGDAVYDPRWDQWSIPVGEDGLLFYAVVPRPGPGDPAPAGHRPRVGETAQASAAPGLVGGVRAAALLALTVVDAAVGSGHGVGGS